MITPDLVVYHDGSCPVCRLEIGRYRRSAGAKRIDFVDVSDPETDPGPDLPREDAMGRFHVRLPSGELKSGASAFVQVWRVLTYWRPAAIIASLPGAIPALDFGYRLVSPFRPAVARLLTRFGRSAGAGST